MFDFVLIGFFQFFLFIDLDDFGCGLLVMGFNYGFIIVVMMVVVFCFYVCRKVGNWVWGWDDWLMLVVVIFQVVCECLFVLLFKYGFGKYDYSIQKLDQFVEIMKWVWIVQGFGQVMLIVVCLFIIILFIIFFGVY